MREFVDYRDVESDLSDMSEDRASDIVDVLTGEFGDDGKGFLNALAVLRASDSDEKLDEVAARAVQVVGGGYILDRPMIDVVRENLARVLDARTAHREYAEEQGLIDPSDEEVFRFSAASESKPGNFYEGMSVDEARLNVLARTPIGLEFLRVQRQVDATMGAELDAKLVAEACLPRSTTGFGDAVRWVLDAVQDFFDRRSVEGPTAIEYTAVLDFEDNWLHEIRKLVEANGGKFSYETNECAGTYKIHITGLPIEHAPALDAWLERHGATNINAMVPEGQ